MCVVSPGDFWDMWNDVAYRDYVSCIISCWEICTERRTEGTVCVGRCICVHESRRLNTVDFSVSFSRRIDIIVSRHCKAFRTSYEELWPTIMFGYILESGEV
jgi:hypothetical protein